ncbi:MAG: DMT family protein [Chitinophagales bacterium]|nr:DMT family protein [Bacteroidota bacterium]MBP8250215.1 DMT family protein [Chitinophagales bacterium]MBK9507166.1 DMT family protein [Bacteroidota bacterium]MBK9554802.1 DMT family protein [Bacteroidota bacterium]MBL0281221.1 DMT family protein [Bacteroidota bacterium]
MKPFYTILFLIISNVFMTLAWYGHLQFKKMGWFNGSGLWVIILISWGLAFFEYCFQVPANRIGSSNYGGPYSMFQLKIIQEVITLVVFTLMAVFVFKTDTLKWNYLAGFFCMVLAVYFIFKK